MFVSKEIAGMGENSTPAQLVQDLRKKSGVDLLRDLQNVEISSNTGLSERRALVQTWTPDDLVRAYTALRVRILQKGALDYNDKILIEAIEKEGIEPGGTHTTHIEAGKITQIPHGQGLTTTNSRGDTGAGGIRLGVWKTISQK